MSKRDTLINFYELDAMKEFMPKIDDQQKAYTGMPLNQHFLLCGGTGSGKTLGLLNYLQRTSIPKKGTFDKIFMCVKKLEPPNLFLMKKLGPDLLHMYTSVDKFPDVSEFPDLGGVGKKKNNKQWLIVFDDCISENNKANRKKIDDYMIYSRSKGCTVAYLSQSYYQTPIFIRRQMSFLLLCSIKSKKELTSILKDYSIANVSDQTLQEMYTYAKKKDSPNEVTFLKLCTYEVPADKKFSRNFLEFINPSDFVPKEDEE
jgi:hypothetical protein